MRRDDATEAQVRAAAPDLSTWLSANAGSGKTRVLTDRVARLLLDGVSPEHILCLTFTKAAATEMQNRLFRRLGEWAMLETHGLRDELRQLGLDQSLSDGFLRDARTLFARAIETPGGLRIQTIHSFCASLLRRFPLEAGVSPQFQEMEDRAAEMLRAEVLDAMADGPHAPLVRDVAPFLSDDDTDAFLREICGKADVFAKVSDPEMIRAAYGLTDETHARLIETVFLGDEQAFLPELVSVLGKGGKTDASAADKLRAVTGADLNSLGILEDTLLTGPGAREPFSAKIGAFPTKGLLKKHPIDHILPRLDALMARVEAARPVRLALDAAERDISLHAFARVFLPAYEVAKQRRGWLDFDDLITRARDLLSDEKVAAWVLYRLDGGIDHILVDEAQDTSPAQWQVIERLAQEFTSGLGARPDLHRTIFVVGDKKQSIYSFQGADPSEFDRMREDFRARLQATSAPLNAMALEYSFRSAEPILRLVDCTFEGQATSGFVQEQKHRAFKSAMPGRVDLWPHIETVSPEKDGDWFDPVDRVSPRHHTVILAQRIARFIRQSIDDRTPLPVEDGQSGVYYARPVAAGDFLILVRRRGTLFTEIIRACKQEGLPIAGADRLKVMAELAVRDIVALLRFLATQEDDLSLATCLRSPLFGWSEQALFDLAHRRGKAHLWEALREKRDKHAETVSVLSDLLGQTDFLRPYDLIDRILGRHNGRRLLIGRLGTEAEDGINALLGQALAYEQTDIPSLTGFLQWAQTDNLEIKRAADSAGETLRVMTVHGAKGLEAPVVILPDCARPKTDVRSALLTDPQGVLWKGVANTQPARQKAAVQAAKDAQAQERDRLLYVGLTRAEKWLIVAAAGDLGSDGSSWYDKVRMGMERAGAEQNEFRFGPLGAGQGSILGDPDWSHLPMTQPSAPPDTVVTLPDWIDRAAPLRTPMPGTRSPSDLGGAKALSGAQGDSEEIAKARGTVLHTLLEWLAPLEDNRRGDMAATLLQDLLTQTAYATLLPEADALRDEALGVLSAPDLAPYLAADTLAEVPLTADLPGIGRIHGVIDRLRVTRDKITAVDFKSNRTLPATPDQVPEGLLRQMGAYALGLQTIYPGRQIETGLIWTANATYMELPHDLVTDAVRRTTPS